LAPGGLPHDGAGSPACRFHRPITAFLISGQLRRVSPCGLWPTAPFAIKKLRGRAALEVLLQRADLWNRPPTMVIPGRRGHPILSVSSPSSFFSCYFLAIVPRGPRGFSRRRPSGDILPCGRGLPPKPKSVPRRAPSALLILQPASLRPYFCLPPAHLCCPWFFLGPAAKIGPIVRARASPAGSRARAAFGGGAADGS